MTDKLLAGFVALVVIVALVLFAWSVLNITGYYDKMYHVVVTDKQSIGTQNPDLLVIGTSDDHQQIFLAHNSVIWVSISIGATCDFRTYEGGQGIIVIREAKCQ